VQQPWWSVLLYLVLWQRLSPPLPPRGRSGKAACTRGSLVACELLTLPSLLLLLHSIHRASWLSGPERKWLASKVWCHTSISGNRLLVDEGTCHV